MKYKLRLLSLAILFLLACQNLLAQTIEPLELAGKIFGKANFPELQNFCTGEYKGLPSGKELQSGTNIRFTELGRTENTAVINLTLTDSLGNGFDAYLHFVKDSIWKMCAFRALAMTGMIEQIKFELEKLSDKEVEKIIADAKKKKKNKNSFIQFGSREEYEFELGNARLTLALDDTLVQFFNKNKTDFEHLKNLAFAQLDSAKTDELRNQKLLAMYELEYKKMFIHSVWKENNGLGSLLNFNIGGILDNSVGYLYVKDKKDLPEMSPNRYIMIRDMGNGWYLYKTT